MSTRQQRRASRANGQKSHGPITPEGKAKSRFNALKHGIHAETQIMFDETPEDLAELDAELRAQYSPADATERFLVDTLIHNEWRLRRMRRVEAVLWEQASQAFLGEHMERNTCNSADTFVRGATAFERLQRVVSSCERNYHRALKQLLALIDARNTPQPEEAKAASESSGPFRTSPEITPTAPANPAQPAVGGQIHKDPSQMAVLETPIQAASR
jgi:hypothetical protein